MRALSRQWHEIAQKLRLLECRNRMEKVAEIYESMAREQARRPARKPLVVLGVSEMPHHHSELDYRWKAS